jgi:hypothetical protein
MFLFHIGALNEARNLQGRGFIDGDFSVYCRQISILRNIGDKRSFSGTKWKKNLGKLRAEQFSFYPLLYEGEER